MRDYEQSLKKLIRETFIEYRGWLIEKCQGKFIFQGRLCDTEAQARRFVDELFPLNEVCFSN